MNKSIKTWNSLTAPLLFPRRVYGPNFRRLPKSCSITNPTWPACIREPLCSVADTWRARKRSLPALSAFHSQCHAALSEGWTSVATDTQYNFTLLDWIASTGFPSVNEHLATSKMKIQNLFYTWTHGSPLKTYWFLGALLLRLLHKSNAITNLIKIKKLCLISHNY